MRRADDGAIVRVLVVAGGGVFGYIPSVLLDSVMRGLPLADRIDAIAGTSIGGLLALLYGTGRTTGNVRAFFEKQSPRIFHVPAWYHLWPFGPSHPDKAYNKILKGVLDTPFGSMAWPTVVPALDITRRRPKVYDNMGDNPDRAVPAWEIARATSAAPTYFNPWKGMVDGGLVENTPVLAATTALKARMGIPFERMSVMMLGTGKYMGHGHTYNIADMNKWTALQWLQPMLQMLTEANEMSTDFIARQMGYYSYCRFNPVLLDEAWAMDNPDVMGDLLVRAEEYAPAFRSVWNEFTACEKVTWEN